MQSACRYARNPEDPDDGAVVFVRSSALPEEYVEFKIPGAAWLASDRQARLVECREEAGEHGAHLYRALAGLGTEPAVVDTTPEETANSGVWETSTW